MREQVPPGPRLRQASSVLRMTRWSRALAIAMRVVSSVWFAAAVALGALIASTAVSVHLREAGQFVPAVVASGAGMAVGGSTLGTAVRRRTNGRRHEE